MENMVIVTVKKSQAIISLVAKMFIMVLFIMKELVK